MDKKWLLPAILVGFAIIVVALFVSAPLPQEPSTVARPSVPSSPPGTAGASGTVDPAPSAENVSHAYRLREAELLEVVEAAPDDTTALLAVAHFYHDAHQPDQAAPFYARYRDLRPLNRQVWLDLVACYGDQKLWEEARSTSVGMLALWPDDPSAMYNLGAIHANNGEFDEARVWWKKVAANTDDPEMAAKAAQSLAQI